MLVKTLVALATEKMLLKTSGKTFLRGIDFMYAAGLAPERLSVMMTSSGKYVLQFHSKCDIRPFAANYPSFTRVLRGIVHVRAWRIRSIEFVNVAFDMKDVDNLERTIDKLGVELVLLRNCTYPGVRRGEEAIRFLNALNRKKQAVVCEYGDDRLKHRISRRRTGQGMFSGAGPAAAQPAQAGQAAPPAALAEHAANAFVRVVQQEFLNINNAAAADVRRRNMPYHLRRRDRNMPLDGAAGAAHVDEQPGFPAAVSPQMMEQMLRRFRENVDGAAANAANARLRGVVPPAIAVPVAAPAEEEADHEEMDLDEDRPPQFYPVQDEPVAVEAEGETTDDDAEW